MPVRERLYPAEFVDIPHRVRLVVLCWVASGVMLGWGSGWQPPTMHRRLSHVWVSMLANASRPPLLSFLPGQARGGRAIMRGAAAFTRGETTTTRARPRREKRCFSSNQSLEMGPGRSPFLLGQQSPPIRCGHLRTGAGGEARYSMSTPPAGEGNC